MLSESSHIEYICTYRYAHALLSLYLRACVSLANSWFVEHRTLTSLCVLMMPHGRFSIGNGQSELYSMKDLRAMGAIVI